MNGSQKGAGSAGVWNHYSCFTQFPGKVPNNLLLREVPSQTQNNERKLSGLKHDYGTNVSCSLEICQLWRFRTTPTFKQVSFLKNKEMTLNLCSAVRDMVVLSSPTVSAEATLTSSGVSSFSTFLCFSFPLFFLEGFRSCLSLHPDFRH